MTDLLTGEIRRALAELVDAAPLPPDLPLLFPTERRPVGRPYGRRRVVAGAAVAAAVAAVAAVPLVLQDRDPRPTTVVAEPPVAGSGAGAPAPIGPLAVPAPTFVLPADLPAGLRFVEAGSASITPGGQQVVVLAGPDGRAARLAWHLARCDQPSPVTTTRDGSFPREPATTLAPSPGGAAWTSGGTTGALLWCLDGNVFVSLHTEGFDEAAARALAATVVRLPGDPADLTLTVPDGFIAARATAAGPTTKAAYASPAGARLSVQVQGAWTTDVGLLEADGWFGQTTRVTPGGRAGFLVSGSTNAGPRTQYLTVVYDERTIVSLASADLTYDQIMAAAASLRPADPSLAPDVAGDRARCERLGFCG